VLTGIGVINPLGLSADAFWTSLLQGKSGIKPISSFDASALPTRFGGEITGFDAKQFLDKKDRKSLRVMARSIQLAVSAAQLAMNDSKVDKERLDRTRFGVEFGASLIGSELEELAAAAQISVNGESNEVDLQKWGEKGLAVIPPLWMLKYLPNMLACHVSILHDAQGPNNSITESDVASLLALGEAYRIIARDGADFFLVGGGESRLNPLSLARQALFHNCSVRNDAPERASRPFDRDRDGMVIGEGSGVVVLEELEHARQRGARIYAEVVGFGTAFGRDRSGSGLARAVQAALADAGIGPEDVDHVNAHGVSTRAGDAWEARGLHGAFKSRREPVPVYAPKSYFGNLGAAAGTTELAASALAMVHGLLPPTLNYEQPDPECPINVVAREPRPVTGRYFVKVGFTDLGQCGAVVCRKWE
jgi:3-oxoacyl-[acyl-carrier-protein] synthase II